MSILLDALRKSEQRNRRGGVPDINSASPEPATPGRERLGPLIGILLATAVAALFWFAWRQYAPPDSGPEPVAAVAEEVPREAAADPGGETAAAADSQALVAKARTPVESLAPAQNTARPGDAAGPAASGAKRPPAEPRNTDRSGADGANQATAKRNAKARRKKQATAEAEQPEPAATEPRQPAPISYWELPQSIREELPEFRISVLVFAEQPEDRFILLNGKRAEQDEEIGPDLKLQLILRDMAVFTYRKYRFYVKQ